VVTIERSSREEVDMGAFQPTHLLFIAIVALVIFGPKRLPEMGRSIGEAMREFKRSMNRLNEDEPSPEPKNQEPTAL
jgi:sec-independent protein translocase protein TatA